MKVELEPDFDHIPAQVPLHVAVLVSEGPAGATCTVELWREAPGPARLLGTQVRPLTTGGGLISAFTVVLDAAGTNLLVARATAESEQHSAIAAVEVS